MIMSTSKRRPGDRRDGTLLRDLDSMHLIMPMVYPNRCDNEAFISERIDLTNIDKYIESKNAENPLFKFTLFHLVVTAMLKVIILRPKLNRFIANKNYYERNSVSASFVIKRQFNDVSDEGMAFVTVDGQDSITTIREDLYKQITNVKKGGTDSTMDAMNFLKTLPKCIVNFAISVLHFMDRHGWVPRSISAADPYYASVIFSNLGSIKLKSGYHHLTNWGTTSIFCVVGEMKKRPFYDDEGNMEYKNSVDLGLTIDERIADGYYYSKSVKMLKYILEHPECLELPLATPIDM